MGKYSYYSKSNQIFHHNVRWLLWSGIRIKSGLDRGAFYGWKDLPSDLYPFIYSEITGYAITALSWIYTELGKPEALYAAKESFKWIVKNMESYLLVAGRSETADFDQKGNLSNQIYAFDNGIIIIGLLSLYKITLDSQVLVVAENMMKALIKHFFRDSMLTTALLDRSYDVTDYGRDKWSTVPGPHHCKLSLALLDLSSLTKNSFYSKLSDSLCDFSISFQQSEGRFITNHDLKKTFLHPHLYACEGLIYASRKRRNEDYLIKGLEGVKWATEQIDYQSGGLPRVPGNNPVEQSDCMAQLLRLLILCHSPLLEKKFFSSERRLDYIIDKLHKRLLDFYISSGKDKGGLRYHLSLETVCSWCTMFCMQALNLWKKRKDNNLQGIEWIDFYI